MTNPCFDIAIVGGGASGTLLALQLLRQSGGRARVALIERGSKLGRGVAYATTCADHLLNTRAGDMSVWPDQPDHFVRWLASQGRDPQQPFVARGAYGDYLDTQLAAALAESAECLSILNAEVVDLDATPTGVTLQLSSGEPVAARLAVLATGHRPPSGDDGGFRGNPWSEAALDGLPPAASVLIIGTGLTMIDLVVSLVDRGHAGPITAISRRGLLPRQHPAKAGHPEMPAVFASGELSKRLGAFRRLSRAGRPWAELMLALRPHMAELWEELDQRQRERFLRHLRPWWDVHRHRVAPDVGQAVQDARQSGQLKVMRARIAALEASPDHVDAMLVPNGAGKPESHRFDRVVDCRGPRNDVASDPGLVGRLGRKGLVRPDPLGLGIDVDDDDRVLGPDSARLFALGPPTRGRHWEITAVPDIRKRAVRLAATLLARLGESA